MKQHAGSAVILAAGLWMVYLSIQVAKHVGAWPF